jgi:hypothetical protein
MVASAAMRFDERIALMPALYRRAVDLAAGLGGLAGLRVNPAVPHTNMMHLYFDARPTSSPTRATRWRRRADVGSSAAPDPPRCRAGA